MHTFIFVNSEFLKRTPRGEREREERERREEQKSKERERFFFYPSGFRMHTTLFFSSLLHLLFFSNASLSLSPRSLLQQRGDSVTGTDSLRSQAPTTATTTRLKINNKMARSLAIALVALIAVAATASSAAPLLQDALDAGWESRWTHSSDAKYTGRFKSADKGGVEVSFC
jgi:hypothetical protein